MSASNGHTGLVGRVRRAVIGRVPTADLDERDPDYIRETLPRLWLLSSLWFRGEVRGLGNVPEEGPVLLVGNHSGGNLTPDTTVFTLAFSTYFGVERAFHQLAHIEGNSRNITGEFMLTDVWVKRNGEWKIIERHSSRQEKAA